MKILLIILGVTIIGFGLVYFLYYRPTTEAAKGGTKGKPSSAATTSPTPRPSTSVSPSISPSTSPSGSALFSDDFSGTLSKWEEVFKTASIVSGELDLKPLYTTYTTGANETHAPLVATGDTAWRDYIYTVKMKTIAQLRTDKNPNPWEVGWLIFRYQNQGNFYYFIHKTNGIELGKLVNSAQQFIATDEAPVLAVGTSHRYKVVLKGTSIKIYIDDALVMSATDSTFSSGKIGLYNEDAEVLYDDVVVTAN